MRKQATMAIRGQGEITREPERDVFMQNKLAGTSKTGMIINATMTN